MCRFARNRRSLDEREGLVARRFDRVADYAPPRGDLPAELLLAPVSFPDIHQLKPR